MIYADKMQTQVTLQIQKSKRQHTLHSLLIAMYEHRLGLYCILLRVLLYP